MYSDSATNTSKYVIKTPAINFIPVNYLTNTVSTNYVPIETTYVKAKKKTSASGSSTTQDVTPLLPFPWQPGGVEALAPGLKKDILSFVLRQNWPLDAPDAYRKALALNAKARETVDEALARRTRFPKFTAQFFCPPRTRSYALKKGFIPVDRIISYALQSVISSSPKVAKNPLYENIIRNQQPEYDYNYGMVELSYGVNSASGLQSWVIDSDASGFSLILYFNQYNPHFNQYNPRLAESKRHESCYRFVAGYRFDYCEDNDFVINPAKSFVVRSLFPKHRAYFNKDDLSVREFNTELAKHTHAVVYSGKDDHQTTVSKLSLLTAFQNLMINGFNASNLPVKVTEDFKAPFFKACQTLFCRIRDIPVTEFISYTHELVEQFITPLYSKPTLWRDLFPDKIKAKPFFDSLILLGNKSFGFSSEDAGLYDPYLRYTAPQFAELWSAQFHQQMLEDINGLPYTHTPWAIRKTISNWHDLVINSWDERYVFPFDREFISSSLKEFLTFYVGSYNFYSLFKEFFSDNLAEVDSMYSPHYIFHTARVNARGGDGLAHRADVVKVFMQLLEVLRPLTSIEKLRRYFLEVFVPMQNLDDLDEPLPVLHAHWGDVSKRITDTVVGLNAFKKYVDEGKAIWDYINFSNCRTISILHDIVAVANNSLSHPPIPNQNPIYKHFEGDAAQIPNFPFEIVVPETSNTLRAWGTEQGHCIGNFADNVNTPDECYLGVRNTTTGKWLGHILAKGKISFSSNHNDPGSYKNDIPQGGTEWEQAWHKLLLSADGVHSVILARNIEHIYAVVSGDTWEEKQSRFVRTLSNKASSVVWRNSSNQIRFYGLCTAIPGFPARRELAIASNTYSDAQEVYDLLDDSKGYLRKIYASDGYSHIKEFVRNTAYGPSGIVYSNIEQAFVPRATPNKWVTDWVIDQFYGKSNSEIDEPLRSRILYYVLCLLNGETWVDPDAEPEDEILVEEKDSTERSVEHPQLTKD